MSLEASVIAHMLSDEEFKHVALQELNSFSFRENPGFRVVFDTIRDLTRQGKPTTLTYISEYLFTKISSEKVIVPIASADTYSSHALDDMQLLKDRNTRGIIKNFAKKLETMAGGGHTTSEIIDVMMKQIERIQPVSGGHKATKIGSMTEPYYDALMVLQKSKAGIRGISCGFTWLDGKLSGLNRKNLIVVAANPSMGKSAFALQVALSVALSGKSVLFHSIEMPREELLDRCCSQLGEVDHWRIRNGWTADAENSRILDVLNKVHEIPLYIDDSTDCGVSDIKREIRKVKNKEGSCDLVIVDLLQKMRYEAGGSDNQRISATTKALELLSKSEEVPLVLLSHLNRANEKREDKTPILSDLRGSGMIEGDANSVVFLHAEDKMDEWRDIIIAKNRGGGLGVARFNWQGKFVRFDEPEQYKTFSNY